MTWVTQILAEYICQLRSDDIPPSARKMAKKCILDLVGSAIVGYSTNASRAVRDFSLKLYSAGPSSVWFSGSQLQAPAAAFINSTSASALDLDDGHRASGGHPGASIIPAAMAVAQEVQAGSKELLTAIVLGYDVAVRIAAARDFSALDTFSTGRWCSYGAAAAGGWLRQLAPDILAEALAIAGVQSPGLSAAGYSSVMGNSVKEGIPWSTLTGLSALDLAVQGFTGPTDILDHVDYYVPEKIAASLGDSFAIETVYFKPYSCCRWIHSAIDALCELMVESQLEAREIEKVEVYTFERALRLNNYPSPKTLESAQYSIPFCLAVVALENKEALLPMKPELLGRSDLVAFARNIELYLDPVLDKLFPGCTPALVILKTTRGSFRKLIENPLGDTSNPLGLDELKAKFSHLAQGYLSSRKQHEMMEAILSIEEGDLKRLFHLLQQQES